MPSINRTSITREDIDELYQLRRKWKMLKGLIPAQGDDDPHPWRWPVECLKQGQVQARKEKTEDPDISIQFIYLYSKDSQYDTSTFFWMPLDFVHWTSLVMKPGDVGALFVKKVWAIFEGWR